MNKNTTTGQSHSFDVGLLIEYGFYETVLITQMIHWISFNKRRGKNYRNGKTWTYQTHNDMLAHNPYLENRFKIMRAIKSLVKKGIIEKNNFNSHNYDKTNWYAFVEEKKWIKATELKEELPSEESHILECEESHILECEESHNLYQIHNNIHKNNNKEAAAAAVYLCLKEVDIPLKEKEWLTETYTQVEIENAIAYCNSPHTKIKTTYIATLKWACKAQPEIPMPDKQEDIRERVIELYGHLDGKTLLTTKHKIPIRVDILSEYMEFTSSGRAWKLFKFDNSSCIGQIKKCLQDDFPDIIPHITEKK